MENINPETTKLYSAYLELAFKPKSLFFLLFSNILAQEIFSRN